MPEAVQIALIGLVGAVVVAWLNNRKVQKKLDHITFLTNSTLSAANQLNEKLETENAVLKQTIRNLKR